MNWVLFANLILILLESVDNLSHWTVPLWMHESSRLFTWAYVLEVVIKLSVKSWEEYWSSPANQFDFWTTWLLLGTSLLKYLPQAVLQVNLSHYANVLRLLRLVRVVKHLKKYPRVQFMFHVVRTMIEAAGDILGLLGTMLFFFVTFSVNFFGGLLYEGNEKLEGTDYEKKHWYVFNFNDSFMAFATWFTNLLEEYVPEQAEALQLVCSWGDVAWYIFPIFYIVGVSILFEVLVAFTVETYLALKEEHDGAEEEEEDEAAADKLCKAATTTRLAMIDTVQKRLEEQGERLHCTIKGHSSSLKALVVAYKEKLEEEHKT